MAKDPVSPKHIIENWIIIIIMCKFIDSDNIHIPEVEYEKPVVHWFWLANINKIDYKPYVRLIYSYT